MRYLLALFLLACASVPPAAQEGPDDAEARRRQEEEAADIPRYVRNLESKNAAVCMDAVDYIPWFGTRAVPALIEELKSESSNGRGLAAAALARIPDKRAVEPLIALLGDKGGVELNVISDDGSELHPAYDNPALNVDQQVRMALTSITGKRFAKKEQWEKWWKENKAGFDPAEVPSDFLPFRRDEYPIPSHAKFLKGVRIAVDPGHGGDLDKRGWKRGPTYMSETELNLRVARFLMEFLEEAGAEVFLTRYRDADSSLKDRALFSGKVRADFFFSIHHNWAPRLTLQSSTTWYHKSADHKPASVDLARYIQEEAMKVINPDDLPQAGGLMADYLIFDGAGFGVLRTLPPEVPGCLLELSYYSNLEMERKLRDIRFNRREAHAIFLGIAKYLFYGIPRAEVISADPEALRLQVYDGTEGRGAWKQNFRILSEFIRVKVDGEVVGHSYDDKKGVIEVRGPFAGGEHKVLVDLINIHKNHSWPRPLEFRVP